MNRVIKLILIIAFLNINFSNACSYNNCKEDETILIFFNGVNNDRKQAMKSRDELKKRFGDKAQDGTTLKYDYFYNTTISEKIDILETLDLRLRAQGSSLVERYETINPFARTSFNVALMIVISKVQDKRVAGIAMSVQMILATASKSVKDLLVNSLAKSPTLADYVEHVKELDKLMKQGKKLLFIAHSQGNIFANYSYEYAMNKNYNKNAIKVVHIAPASTELNGDYILADKDIIISDYLRKFNLTGKVKEANQEIPINEDDPNGHGFLETYLNPKLEISKITEKLISNNLNSLHC